MAAGIHSRHLGHVIQFLQICKYLPSARVLCLMIFPVEKSKKKTPRLDDECQRRDFKGQALLLMSPATRGITNLLIGVLQLTNLSMAVNISITCSQWQLQYRE